MKKRTREPQTAQGCKKTAKTAQGETATKTSLSASTSSETLIASNSTSTSVSSADAATEALDEIYARSLQEAEFSAAQPPSFADQMMFLQQMAMSNEDIQALLTPLGLDNAAYQDEDEFDDTYEGLLSLAENMGQVKPKGMPTRLMQSIHSTTCQANSDAICTICLDCFAKGDSQCQLACAHIFHAACVKTWLLNSLVCPL